MLVTYFDNGGYATDTDVAGMGSGHDIYFKASKGAGTFRMYLVETNPSTGAVLDTFGGVYETALAARRDACGRSGSFGADRPSIGGQLVWIHGDIRSRCGPGRRIRS